MDRKMNFFIMFFIFIIVLAFTSHISYTQSLITGSTTWGTEIVTISPDRYTPKISELLRGTGLDEITCKFITLDGKNNEIKINVPFLSSEFDLDTGGGELKAGFEVVNLFISSSRGEKNNWVGVEGKLGGHAIRFELSFKPGFKAITSSTAQDPNNLTHTTFRIRLFNKDNNTYKTLFEKSTTEWEKTDKNETEITEIKNVIHNLFQALNDLNWDNAKNCCVYRSMAYDQVNRIEETLYITLGNNLSLNISETIDKIVIDGENAKAYLLLTSIQFEERTSNKEWFYLQKINNTWKLYRMGPVKKDSIKILSLTPNSGLQDGVKTKFKIIVEYNLTSYNKGKLDIGFSTINPANWKTIESETFYISKGSGTHEFNIHVIPKNWGKQGVFSVSVSIDEVPKSDNICLDSDLEILSF